VRAPNLNLRQSRSDKLLLQRRKLEREGKERLEGRGDGCSARREQRAVDEAPEVGAVRGEDVGHAARSGEGPL
jgi:hypothetical protein